MKKNYFVYILGSNTGTLYIGVTNDLKRRVWEHKHDLVKGFSQKYSIHNLLYFEEFYDVNQAIEAEKKLKGWRRSKKIELIRSINPEFRDLMEGN